MSKKSNKLEEDIVTVGDLIDCLEKNFDRDHFLVHILMATTDGTSDDGIRSLWSNYKAGEIVKMKEREQRREELVLTHEGTTLSPEAIRGILEHEGWRCERNGIHTRVWKILVACNVKYAVDLRKVSILDLRNVGHCGPLSIAAIKTLAKYHGYKIGGAL